MKHLNFKITIVILSTIFAGYFSATSANAIIIGGGGGQTYDPATNVTTPPAL